MKASRTSSFRLRASTLSLLLGGSAMVAAAACSGDGDTPNVVDGPCRAQGRSAGDRFADGDALGHAEPQGAKAAGQARDGKLRSSAQIRLPKNPRARVKPGDYLLANDKIAVYIGDEQLSDGMSMFGGEILALDVVGDDGLPSGGSEYGETLFALSRQVLAPEKVSVLKDGSDGGEAIVRAQGVLQDVAFLDPFRGLLPHEYFLPVALDYVLRPGEDFLTVRLSLMNTKDEDVDFANRQNTGFFHAFTSQLFTPARGFGVPQGFTDWVAFEGREPLSHVVSERPGPARLDPSRAVGFALRSRLEPYEFGLSLSGFENFQNKGLTLPACGEVSVDYAEMTVALGGVDGVRHALSARTGERLRAVHGTVERADGTLNPQETWVFAHASDGTLHSRTRTDAQGRFALHVPEAATLSSFSNGFGLSAAVAAPTDDASITLRLPAHGTLKIEVRDVDSGEGLPVRIQILPETPAEPLPARLGVAQWPDGAQDPRFALEGDAEIEVPPGRHRVIVSRGYEYELHDEVLEVRAGETTAHAVSLARSVDSSGVMCADFHIHTNLSFDSDDSIRAKVASAVADGLELPISSEHEWVLDFMPTVRELGLEKWAFSFPSEELTTFRFGHFGVVPLLPRPERRNNGAVHWIGRPLGAIFDEVRALPEQPVLIVNHPSNSGFMSYLQAVGFDPKTASSSDENWSEHFDALEVFNDSSYDQNRDKSVRDWYALLRAGKKYFAVGASDSHHIRSAPVGYPRTCLQFGHDDPSRLTMEAVRDTLRSGNGTISGGIFLRVRGPGGAEPWQSAHGGGEFEVTVQAPSFVGVKELEVVVDGVVTQTLPLEQNLSEGPGQRFQHKVQVAAPGGDGTHFVVFHVRGEGTLAPLHPERVPFAVSNPIWL